MATGDLADALGRSVGESAASLRAATRSGLYRGGARPRRNGLRACRSREQLARGRTSRGLSDTTRRDYRRSIEYCAIPFFRGYRLAEIEPPDIRAFIAEMESGGLAPASVVKNLSPLKAIFATAVEDCQLRLNPTIGVRVNGRSDECEEPEAKAMTRQELSRVLKALPAPWLLFFELLLPTGVRISEALGLEWSDVSFGERPALSIVRQHYRGDTRRLKSQKARRELPLSPGMARHLWAARPAAGRGPMFATSNETRLND